MGRYIFRIINKLRFKRGIRRSTIKFNLLRHLYLLGSTSFIVQFICHFYGVVFIRLLLMEVMKRYNWDISSWRPWNYLNPRLWSRQFESFLDWKFLIRLQLLNSKCPGANDEIIELSIIETIMFLGSLFITKEWLTVWKDRLSKNMVLVEFTTKSGFTADQYNAQCRKLILVIKKVYLIISLIYLFIDFPFTTRGNATSLKQRMFQIARIFSGIHSVYVLWIPRSSIYMTLADLATRSYGETPVAFASWSTKSHSSNFHKVLLFLINIAHVHQVKCKIPIVKEFLDFFP